jgi:hypothetical protein
MNASGKFGQPIYVGKAVPKGARKGGLGLDAALGLALRSRLREHARTIEQTNLRLLDFHCRTLTVDDIWIPLGENVVIEKFQPLWNRVIDGFGIKTPGKGRAGQRRSSWDELHPGRAFVGRLKLEPSKLSRQQIVQRIAAYFAGRLPESELLSPAEQGDGASEQS